MSSRKQFTLHGDVTGPNPLKVAVVLEELGRRRSWNQMAIGWGLEGVEGGDVQKEFPNVYKWHQKLVSRPIVRKFLDMQAEAFRKFSESQAK